MVNGSNNASIENGIYFFGYFDLVAFDFYFDPQAGLIIFVFFLGLGAIFFLVYFDLVVVFVVGLSKLPKFKLYNILSLSSS